MNKSDIYDLPTEGSVGFKALCKLARDLGYVDPFQQLINSDGKSCVGDLICFLEDNPGAIQTIYEFVAENFEMEEEVDDES